MRVLIALDKFRGTATAAEATAAVGHACWELGLDADEVPMSDGGEGLLDVLGGPNRTSIVTGPLGDPVTAAWRLDRRTAVIEMATASGLALVGGAEGNDPLGASTVGTGELIDRALAEGARSVIVGLGGSATTDGGLGAIDALRSPARVRSTDVAWPATCAPRSSRRLRCSRRRRAPRRPRSRSSPPGSSSWSGGTRRVRRRRRRHPGRRGRRRAGRRAGRARGPPGRRLRPRRRAPRARRRVAAADVVVTGEGYLDEQSLEGKVVGGVCDLAAGCGRPVVVIVGDADPAVAEALGARSGPGVSVLSLIERYGEQRAFDEPRWCIEHAAAEALGALRSWRRRCGPGVSRRRSWWSRRRRRAA